MPQRAEYDAIIVGGGPNGLAAAITLARASLRVLIIEGTDTIGGGSRTAELTLAGFRHDVCAAVHPLGAASSFFRSMPLAEYGLEWIIAYKGLGNLGGFTSDLAAAINQAVADGVDVINYSIGGGAGAVTADEIAFLLAADAGVFVATSAGNSGPNPSTLGDPGTKPWVTTVGASTQSRFLQGTVILGNGAQYTGASITAGVGPAPLVDAAAAGGDLCVPGSLNPALVSGKIVLCRRGTVGRDAKSQAVVIAGGVGMIMYENSDAGNLFSDTHWVPSVHVDNTPGLAIKSYIVSDPNPTAQIMAPQTGVWPYAPSMTDFSSRGPNPVAPDIIKPDVTAPGLQILAGNSPFPDAGSVRGELFQAIAGTSMSSPHVAGVYALLKQAHPEWSAAMAKSALMTTASQNVLKNTGQARPILLTWVPVTLSPAASGPKVLLLNLALYTMPAIGVGELRVLQVSAPQTFHPGKRAGNLIGV